MAEKDTTLVKVLERLAGEMTQLEVGYEVLLARMDELAKTVESSSLHLRGKQDNAERSYDKLFDAISHYRSDMLSLVNEQDRVNKNIEELQKDLKTTTFTADVTSKKIIETDERLERHEKASNEFYEHAYKQPDRLESAIKDTSRDFTSLHAGTEKHLIELQREIEEQLRIFSHETARRLLLLDNITTDLQVLIARTEPPEKKPFWIKRLSIKLRSLLRRKGT